jgi:broad specificity phosphatase PhoE
MSFVYLVRHAQASFGAENYDQLSELGRTQSRWLGEYFAARGLRFARVVAGTLVRQQDTARGVLAAMGADAEAVETHAGLDEYHAEALYAAHTGGADPRTHQRADYRDYWRTFRAAMRSWADGTLRDVPETWDEFGARVNEALASACRDAGRDENVLVVSSGGAIARALVDVLGSPGHVAIELNLQFRNTAFCELLAGGSGLRLISLNTLPHLEEPARRHAITAT